MDTINQVNDRVEAVKDTNFDRIRWQCRRGLLELDVILQCFCDSVYIGLTYEKQKLFEDLLTSSDTDLQRWLIKAEVCDKPEWQDLIMIIRHQYAMQLRTQA